MTQASANPTLFCSPFNDDVFYDPLIDAMFLPESMKSYYSYTEVLANQCLEKSGVDSEVFRAFLFEGPHRVLSFTKPVNDIRQLSADSHRYIDILNTTSSPSQMRMALLGTAASQAKIHCLSELVDPIQELYCIWAATHLYETAQEHSEGEYVVAASNRCGVNLWPTYEKLILAGRQSHLAVIQPIIDTLEALGMKNIPFRPSISEMLAELRLRIQYFSANSRSIIPTLSTDYTALLKQIPSGRPSNQRAIPVPEVQNRILGSLIRKPSPNHPSDEGRITWNPSLTICGKTIAGFGRGLIDCAEVKMGEYVSLQIANAARDSIFYSDDRRERFLPRSVFQPQLDHKFSILEYYTNPLRRMLCKFIEAFRAKPEQCFQEWRITRPDSNAATTHAQGVCIREEFGTEDLFR